MRNTLNLIRPFSYFNQILIIFQFCRLWHSKAKVGGVPVRLKTGGIGRLRHTSTELHLLRVSRVPRGSSRRRASCQLLQRRRLIQVIDNEEGANQQPSLTCQLGRWRPIEPKSLNGWPKQLSNQDRLWFWLTLQGEQFHAAMGSALGLGLLQQFRLSGPHHGALGL